MTDDLEAPVLEVHARTREILGFWFDGLMPEQHYGGTASLDWEIRERFGPVRDQVLRSGAAGWRDDPRSLLAAVILLDQCSRNAYRGKAEAFAGDALARELTLLAIERGWDRQMTAEQRQFLYMPLLHAEDRELQALSLRCFEALGNARSLDYARRHAEVIARFGRFPTRNEALGRISTPDEIDYLSQPGVGW